MNSFHLEYKIQEIYKDTYSISDPGIGIGEVYMYLLVGTKKAMLIDSGYGILNLSEIICGITDKDVICVCTHGHLDHAMGAWQFKKAYLHSKDFEVYQRHSDPGLIRIVGNAENAIINEDPIKKNPMQKDIVECMANTSYPLLQALDNIKEFDLGDRTVSWRLLPGHTQGSIALFDEKNHVIFDGDGAPSGVWLFLPESSTLSQYINNLEEYRNYLNTCPMVARYAGHAASPMTIADLDALRNCCQYALDHPVNGIPFSTPFGNTLIYISDNTAVFAPA